MRARSTEHSNTRAACAEKRRNNVSDLVASVHITQSAVSQQLAVLKSAGLVEERAAGRFRHYRLRVEPLAEVDAWMSQYRSLLERQLDALGRVLDEQTPKRKAPARKRRRTGGER
jgi:DNA-binding transcriptional ArsR family regulator